VSVPDCQSVQWAPPGRRVVWSWNETSPSTLEYSALRARELDVQLQDYRDIAGASGTPPGGCVNHWGQPQAFEALAFKWAGDGPAGGIHLLLKWTAIGRQIIECNPHVEISGEYTVDPRQRTKRFFVLRKPNVGSLVLTGAQWGTPVKHDGAFADLVMSKLRVPSRKVHLRRLRAAGRRGELRACGGKVRSARELYVPGYRQDGVPDSVQLYAETVLSRHRALAGGFE
jgi:hypothetical protein